MKEVKEIIDSRLATIPEGSEIEIGFFGGNFTGIEVDLQVRYLESVQPYIEQGRVMGIRLSTRPDYIDKSVLQRLQGYRVRAIELGAQSLSDEVLRSAGRGHSAMDTRNAASLIRSEGFELGLQMMIGLPGDTPERSLETAREIVRLGALSTRIYPTLVIRDTYLAELWERSEYVPLVLEQAVEQTASIVRIFEDAQVRILRIGLHPSEGLLKGTDLLAGPFHPAFGELVNTAIWRDLLTNGPLDEKLLLQKSELTIEVNPRQLNAAIGHKSVNRIQLQKRIRKVIFRGNESLGNREFIYHIS